VFQETKMNNETVESMIKSDIDRYKYDLYLDNEVNIERENKSKKVNSLVANMTLNLSNIN